MRVLVHGGAGVRPTDVDDQREDLSRAVELGEAATVEGAPIARVTSRLTWPQQAEFVVRKEGDAVIRTPDGPRVLSEILDEVDVTYFDTRQTFVGAVQDVVGTGPVRTETE